MTRLLFTLSPREVLLQLGVNVKATENYSHQKADTPVEYCLFTAVIHKRQSDEFQTSLHLHYAVADHKLRAVRLHRRICNIVQETIQIKKMSAYKKTSKKTSSRFF